MYIFLDGVASLLRGFFMPSALWEIALETEGRTYTDVFNAQGESELWERVPDMCERFGVDPLNLVDVVFERCY